MQLEDYIVETEDTLIIGEEEPTEDSVADKPVRFLTHFTIFDPAHDNTLVSLDELLEVNNSSFEAAGLVSPVYPNEEDAGQDLDTEVDELQRFRTSAILTFMVDYQDMEG